MLRKLFDSYIYILFAMSNKGTSNNLDKILSLDARSLSEYLASKTFSCVEVMEATLRRVEELNPKCKAIILLRDREELLKEARLADEGPRKGWLHGIPIAIKDLSNVVGIPTTMGGSPLFQNFRPCVNDPFVDNILKEGAIIIGKTNTPENGLGSHTFNGRWGTTVNPYDVTKSSGGSSGGAAVAVSVRMLCIADGSDMMGSLRNPAGWNNLYSHRPTAGMIRTIVKTNINPLKYPISTPGPIARTPVDVALLLETMAGKENFDASPFRSNEISTIEGMRIGWLGDWGSALPFEKGLISHCKNALEILHEKGGITAVDDLSKDPIFEASKIWASWTKLRFALVAHTYTQAFDDELLLGENAKIKDDFKWEISQGKQVSSEDLDYARGIAEQWSATVEAVFEKYDALALPSAQVWPFPAERKWPKSIDDTEMDTYHRWMEVAVPVSLGGLPCSTIPAGFGDDGLPMGIQIFGKRGDDRKLLCLATAYHQLTDWSSAVKWSDNPDSILEYDTKRNSPI